MELNILKEKLNNLIANHPNSYTKKVMMKGNEELYNTILFYTNDKIKPDFYKLSTKIYWILNNITEFPKCITCGKELSDKNVKNVLIGYQQCCSSQCAKNSQQRKDKCVKTCLSKYGVENASQSDKIKQKKAETSKQNYGVSNPAKSQVVLSKIQQTMLNTYGVKHALQNPNIKNKATQTLLNNYGVKHALQNHDIRLKSQTRYKYSGICFDSKPELALYIYLLDTNNDFKYQPNISYKYSFENKTYIYMPDFMINGKYYEIKGRHFIKSDGTMQNPWDHSLDALYEAKHKCIKENNVIMILDNDEMINKSYEYIKNKYGDKYLESFRNVKL